MGTGLARLLAVSRIATTLACLLAVAAVGCGADVEEIRGLAYDDRYGTATTMDIYTPLDGREDRPAVMLIHGGGWHAFSKETYQEQAIRLAGAGFVTANINYRLVPDGVYPRIIQDCVCALAFFRAHADDYGFDPDRVALMGYSAGGHLVSLLGVAIEVEEFQPTCAAGSTGPPNAVIAGAGPQDLRELAWADAVQDLIGGTIEEYPERYDLASPIAHVAAGAPPYLFVHGTGDVFVPVEQSEHMRDALVNAGNDARLLTIAGGGHLLNNGSDQGQWDLRTSTDMPEAWAATVDFLDRTVGQP